MRATWVILAAAVLAGGAGLYAAQRLGFGAAASGASVIGTEVPATLALNDLEGRNWPIRPAGRPRLLNYWASWCAPCLEEMPLLDRFAAQQGDSGVEVVGIAMDEPDAIRAFLARTPVAFRILVEAPHAADTAMRFGNTRKVLPFSVLIDADGRVSRLRAGAFRDADDLAAFALGD